MIQQLIGIRDVFDVQQFDLGVRFRIKVLVKVLQHILNTNLLAVADGPYAIEL